MRSILLVAVALALQGAHAMTCPGSKAWGPHASCKMTVTFTESCAEVQKEMLARISGENGWVDPHNKGTYSLLSSSASTVTAKRLTGNKKYTDLFDFTFTAQGSGCSMDACSESQVTSIIDYSTNYCNLHDLYCGSKDGCPVANAQLSYTESLTKCSQHDKTACVPKESEDIPKITMHKESRL